MVETSNENTQNTHKVFRYKFEKEIMDMLTYFAKLHKYDKRIDYKEAWKKWFKENNEVLEREANRIIRLGYIGNIEDKMYKAARYYFLNKEQSPLQSPCTIKDSKGVPPLQTPTTPNNKERSSGGLGVSPNNKECSLRGLKVSPTTTRKYVCISREVLDAIDLHIKANINKPDYTPAKGYDDFFKNHTILLASETLILREKGETDKNYISSKLKKTYKNRYYYKGHSAV